MRSPTSSLSSCKLPTMSHAMLLARVWSSVLLSKVTVKESSLPGSQPTACNVMQSQFDPGYASTMPELIANIDRYAHFK